MKWKPFWFEGNTAWGLICNADGWARIDAAYSGSGADLRLARRGPDKRSADGPIPNYGFRSEHRGAETLGEFFDSMTDHGESDR